MAAFNEHDAAISASLEPLDSMDTISCGSPMTADSSSNGTKSFSHQPQHSFKDLHSTNITVMLDDAEKSQQSSTDEKGLGIDRQSQYTDFTESTLVPRRHFGFIQTTSLMLNGCFAGGNFFATPYYTLALVRSKRICLALWAVGGIYSALGMTLFLEYGTALPYTGGALIYLDEVFHRPRLLATVLFSAWWIFFCTTQGLSEYSAQTILSLATGLNVLEIDVRLIKFTAIAVQTLVCLLLYFARRATFIFNTLFAVYRIVLMIFIFVAGIKASTRPNSGWKDFNVEYPGYNGKETLSAMVFIILCYQGYENANYVTGEVKEAKRTLKWSGITSISILVIFNVLVTMAFFAVADFETLTTPDGQAETAFLFASIVFKSTRGMQIAVLLATFGGLVFITYTMARVKQSIAWQRIIPFSQLFGRQDPYYDSPSGGLFLHWIVTVIAIIALGNNTSESHNFFNGIYTYGYQLMFTFLALGLVQLAPRMREYSPSWKPTYLKNKALMLSISALFVSWNIVTLVMYSLPSVPGQVPHFWWPVAFLVLVAAALLYWAVLRLFVSDNLVRRKVATRVGLEIHVYEDGDDFPDDLKFAMYEAHLDGTRRRLDYKTSGLLGRCMSSLHKLKNAIIRFLAY